MPKKHRICSNGRLPRGLVASFAGLALAVAPSAHAASETWAANAAGAWDTITSNWTPNAAFTSGDNAIFDSASVQNVTSATGLTIGSIALNTGYAGTVTMSGANTVSGPTTINAGTVVLSNISGLGTSQINMGGGTLKVGAASNLSNNIVIGSGNSLITENGTTNFNLTGGLSGSGNVTFGGGGGNATIGLSFTSNTMTGGQITLSGGTTGISRVKTTASSSSAVAWQINGGSTEVSGTFNFGSFSGSGNFAAFNGNSGNITYSIGALNTDATYSGVLSSSGTNSSLSVTKVGTGTWTLSGANTYHQLGTGATPTTMVSAGKLQLKNTTGSATGASVIAVSGGTSATLGGTGTATGATTVTNGSRIAPGTITTASNFGSIGTLTLSGGLTLTNATLDFDLAPTAAGTSDRIALGSSNLAFSTLNFNFSGTTLEINNPYTLISTTGSLSFGDVANITTDFTNVTGGISAVPVYSFVSGTGLQVTFSELDPPSAPEPHEFAIAIVALLCAIVIVRRCKPEAN
jgi:autotransporter-associated beta strand protein